MIIASWSSLSSGANAFEPIDGDLTEDDNVLQRLCHEDEKLSHHSRRDYIKCQL